ncbi:hypothetical protein ACFY30_05910 [Streptomyces sp. NPDC000345]|uniref:hypothetical protein n=1 Tax=Streptomyces sp. NPDC000345 TaxID=3364537 RepID=UPI00368F9D18
MTHVTAHRRKARLIDHAAPPTCEEWRENDARYFEDIEAEIRRRAAGGDPGRAPWTSPLYFDTGHGTSATRRALLALRHLPRGAVVRLVLDRLLHGESIRPATGPGAGRTGDDADTEGREHRAHDGRSRFPDHTMSPPTRGGRTIVASSAGA